MFPSCSPDVIEKWFLQLKSQAMVSNDPIQLMCIKEKAKEVYSRCQKTQMTEKFITTAYNNVTNTATEKLQRLRRSKPKNNKKNDNHLLTFSTGRGKHSAVESFEKFHERQKKLQNLWI